LVNGPRRIVSTSFLLGAIAVWFCLAKTLFALHYLPRHETVEHIAFGFGEYIRSLRAAGTFSSCTGGACIHSSRMPVLPIVFFAISKLSDDLLVATLIKNVCLSIGCAWTFRRLLRLQSAAGGPAREVWGVILALLALSPPVIKHASYAHYEEGLLL